MGANRAWPEELPSVLRAYRTIVRTPTGETPFNLMYSIEAVIPIKIGLTSLKKEFLNLTKLETKLLREWPSTNRRWPSTTTRG